jgi:hypothetical protein
MPFWAKDTGRTVVGAKFDEEYYSLVEITESFKPMNI